MAHLQNEIAPQIVDHKTKTGKYGTENAIERRQKTKSVSRRGGRNKGGRKQMRANANKRRQMSTNASKRRGENASKRKLTRANVDKRKQTQTNAYTPLYCVFFTPPLCNRLTKGCFRKRVVLANVPSFRFSFRGNIRLVPSFRGNIRQNHPFEKPPFKFVCEPATC